jgi:DNA helicase-2/ATP-dependent DNA helicase PcrA
MAFLMAHSEDNLPETLSGSEREYLSTLNEPQKQAVLSTQGPLLVLAGAGTGKTRVLTTRVVHIIHERLAWPSQILAVTFTNKAAQEMRERIQHTLGQSTQGLWLGTFHAIAVKILRRDGDRLGLHAQFTIIDTDDQGRLIREIIRNQGIDEKTYPFRGVIHEINRLKDRGISAERATLKDIQWSGRGVDGQVLLSLYQQYQERLKTSNAVDFGDLLLFNLELFRQFPDVLEYYQKQFKYILVDEYQDTNISQYLWMRLLAMGHGNVCCVGDDDQSIYGWRGAEVTNILRFEKDFPGSQVVRLEENYRSTPHILGAASGLISQNRDRLGKTLWTQIDCGDLVKVSKHWDGEAEARYVADQVENFHRQGDSLASMAILVRASAQTREFEERCLRLGIPYRVVGGARFYERQEIRDALAYLRIVAHPEDSLAFERIINVPKRGVGTSTVQTLHHYARSASVSLLGATKALLDTDELRGKIRSTLGQLLKDFDRWRESMATLSPSELAKKVLDESGYTLMWRQDKSPDSPGRLENLKELVSALTEFESLDHFLEHVSLVMDNTLHHQQDVLTIMTLHSAKGLEFDTVFLVGWEEGLFPNARSLDDNSLEEERRLAYVGLTRAKKRACVSWANSRLLYGSWQSCMPSRFIQELPPEHIELMDPVSGPLHMRSQRDSQKWDYGRSSDHLSTNSFKGSSSKIHESDDGISQENPTKSFHTGDRVFHMKFGYGRVLDIYHDNLSISFEHGGQKNVKIQFIQKA